MKRWGHWEDQHLPQAYYKIMKKTLDKNTYNIFNYI